MSSRIPHLEAALLVIACFYPIGIGANIAAMLRGYQGAAQRPSISRELLGFVVGYAIVVAIVGLARPHEVFTVGMPTALVFFALAPVAGISCIVLEYIIGVVLFFARTGRLVTRMAVHSSYSGATRIAVTDVLAVLALVIAEELVVRQLLYRVLATDFDLSPWLLIASCTVVYAVNHLAFGITSVISKLASGLVYVLLYYASGLSLATVIVAHATQNFTLLALSRRRS